MSTHVDEIDLLSLAVLTDPYPAYSTLREHDPVRWNDALQGWVVTRYDDVYSSLRDPGTYSSNRVEKLVASRVPAEFRHVVAPLINLTDRWMWMQDPPEHTRLRRLMNKGFTPRAVVGMREKVTEIVGLLLDDVEAAGGMDVIADFAYLLPAYVMADVYGLPRDDADELKRWSDALKVFIGGSPDLAGTASNAMNALNEMMEYFGEAVEQRRKKPTDDLISRLVSAEAGGDFLSNEELCANLLLVLGASYVTTMDMMGNGVLALMRQRDQWHLLIERPDLIGAAINEILRYDGPVQLTHRLATRDIDLAGKRIAAGDLVYLIRGSANRDPARFADPDHLDITRDATAHVAFGAGVHYCIGAALARMEGEIALGELLRRHPDIQLDPDAEVTWRADTLQFRGLRSLPVVFGAGGGSRVA